jgi:predicted metal-dependent phosphoesterase TrpH
MSSPALNTTLPRAPGEAVAPLAGPGRPGFADLHLHTLFSDGTFTPEELAGRGARLGLVAMALTDHDTVEGCARMGQACQSLGMEFISGTELTGQFEGNEVHLLGYFMQVDHPRLLAEMKKFQLVRQDRIREMASRLNKVGVPLRAESVFELANCHSPGRPHVGRALVLEGLCGSMEEAFEKYLKKGRPAWVPKYKISAIDAIELIHAAEGLAVLAHPALNHNDHIIPRLAEQGLDGLECFHTRHSPGMPEHYLQMAARLKLAVTGGSDCHGYSKGKPLIGGVKLAAVYLEKLKQARQNRAQRARAPGVQSA